MSLDIIKLKSEAESLVPLGSRWSHYKGGDYLVLSIDIDATSYPNDPPPKLFVRYQQLYDATFPKGSIWLREFEDFRRKVEWKGERVPRFKIVSGEDR